MTSKDVQSTDNNMAVQELDVVLAKMAVAGASAVPLCIDTTNSSDEDDSVWGLGRTPPLSPAQSFDSEWPSEDSGSFEDLSFAVAVARVDKGKAAVKGDDGECWTSPSFASFVKPTAIIACTTTVPNRPLLCRTDTPRVAVEEFESRVSAGKPMAKGALLPRKGGFARTHSTRGDTNADDNLPAPSPSERPFGRTSSVVLDTQPTATKTLGRTQSIRPIDLVSAEGFFPAYKRPVGPRGPVPISVPVGGYQGYDSPDEEEEKGVSSAPALVSTNKRMSRSFSRSATIRSALPGSAVSVPTLVPTKTLSRSFSRSPTIRPAVFQKTMDTNKATLLQAVFQGDEDSSSSDEDDTFQLPQLPQPPVRRSSTLPHQTKIPIPVYIDLSTPAGGSFGSSGKALDPLGTDLSRVAKMFGEVIDERIWEGRRKPGTLARPHRAVFEDKKENLIHRLWRNEPVATSVDMRMSPPPVTKELVDRYNNVRVPHDNWMRNKIVFEVDNTTHSETECDSRVYPARTAASWWDYELTRA